MSIIERAIDKLASQEASKSKKVSASDKIRKCGFPIR